MIYLKGPGLIFLKPRKVAGTSFEIALSAFAQNADIITAINEDEAIRQQMGFTGPQNHLFPVSELHRLTADDSALARRLRSWPHKFYNHMSAKLAKTRLAEQDWNNATKISILRNPYDAAVSLYFWWKYKTGIEIPFAEWGMKHDFFLSLNQAQYLIDDELAIDRFIRFEHFAGDIAEIELDYPALKGLADVFADINAKGNIRPKGVSAQDMFAANQGMAKLVESKCAFEIEVGGYRLG